MLDGGAPLADPVVLHVLLRSRGGLLGDGLAVLVQHKVFFGQTPDGFHAGALPDLPLLPNGLRLLRLLGLARNPAPSSPTLRGAALASHPSARSLRGRGLAGGLSAFAGHAGFAGDTTGSHLGDFVSRGCFRKRSIVLVVKCVL